VSDALALQLEAVVAGYGANPVLRGISLTVGAGEVVALIGSNGAGKTTTLRTIQGLLRARGGTIRFRGEPIHHLPTDAIVRRGLAHCPEGRLVFPRMSVRENLELGAFVRTDHAAIADDLERMLTTFPRLRERVGQRAGTLSGGEQQMLAMARSLMARPSLLLLDEPSLGLAPMLVQQIFDIIRAINAQGTAVLLVEQNARMALKVARRGYVLETGTIALADDAAALAQNADVKRAYLGM
jgi:branched-chain amino acid transport system ATP-binding protein